MGFNPNASMNNAIRASGNRVRSLMAQPLPNIGQNQNQNQTQTQAAPTSNTAGLPPQAPNPANQPAPVPPGPPTPPMGSMTSPMTAPPVNPQTFTVSPPGSAADSQHYNYEPQPDGSWRVYPPGVPAPPHTVQASMPRAASTADYIRMANAFGAGPPAPTGQAQFPQPMQAPTSNQYT
jgi:hypothetical protein